MRQLVLRLTAEAQKIRKTGGDLPDTPDFAERHPATVDMDELRQVLVKRAHRDPFTDAYVRWQLTSFDPGLPERCAWSGSAPLSCRLGGIICERLSVAIDIPLAMRQ